MKNATNTSRQTVTLREECEGVGLVVENVAWGPRGPVLVAAWLFGWAVRAGLVALGLPCVLVEARAWQEVGYPLLLQCLLYALCLLGTVTLLWLLLTNPCEVRVDDVLHVSPKETVTWTWCSHCRLLRPPGAMHCFLCHRCIDNIHHHCVALWRCVGRKSLPAFITALGALTAVMCINFLMIHEPTAGFRGVLGNYSFIIVLPVLFLLIHSIYSLDSHVPWRPPQVFPSSAFVVRASQSHSDSALFTFCFSSIPSRSGELLRMIFRPLFRATIKPKALKLEDPLQCPNRKCQAVVNHFWLTGGTDGVTECNLCEAAFHLPQDTKGFRDKRDIYCLLQEGQVIARPRLVFVLDAALPEVRIAIHDWATVARGLPDIEVLCFETQTCCTYVDGKLQEEKADQCPSLGATLDRGRREVAAHGGRLVFISTREKRSLKIDALETLVVAASQITLNIVSISRQGVERNPLLQPLVLYHQARGGGWTRVVERPRDVLRLVRSGLFLFWGVRARGRVRWTPGVEVVRAFERGVTRAEGQDADSFSMACLEQGRQVEFSLKVDATTVLHRRRLSDPEDRTVYCQLQLIYTTIQGEAALAVFNRAFSVD